MYLSGSEWNFAQNLKQIRCNHKNTGLAIIPSQTLCTGYENLIVVTCKLYINIYINC